jgi:hypothetical protein
MKCTCESCQGNGVITCQDCGGRGYHLGTLNELEITPEMEHAAELAELEDDLLRVERDASTLEQLRPDRAESYRAQLAATRNCINQQADKLMEVRK